MKCCCQNYPLWVDRFPDPQSWHSYSITSDKGSPFTVKGVRRGPHTHDDLLVLLCSLPNWSHWFSRMCDVLLKTQLQHQLVGDTLCGWGKLLQQVVNALNQCPTYGILSPAAKIHKFKNQGVVIKTAAWPLWAPYASESTRVTVLMWVIDPDYQGQIVLLLYKRGEENMSGIQELTQVVS